MTPFQRLLWEDLEPGVWYDVVDLESGRPMLPGWFYRDQSQPMATIRPMIESGALEVEWIHIVGSAFVPKVRRPVR